MASTTTGVTLVVVLMYMILLMVSGPVPGSAAGSATSSHSQEVMTTFRLPRPAATASAALLLEVEEDLSLLDLGSCKSNCRNCMPRRGLGLYLLLNWVLLSLLPASFATCSFVESEGHRQGLLLQQEKLSKGVVLVGR